MCLRPSNSCCRFRLAATLSFAFFLRSLLLEAAKQTDGVLNDDQSRTADVHFKAMGDYGLDFELLCFIALPEHKFAVIDRLNSAIYKATQAHGIEIPFPQQIVHLASDTHTGQ